MQHRELTIRLDWFLLFASFVTFGSGLVLLFRFHVGPGAFAVAAFGIGKLAWLNIHRLSAAPMLAGVLAHVWLNWRPFRARLKIFSNRKKRKILDPEPILYAAFFLAAASGLIAWLLIKGSVPMLGPALSGPVSGARHPWIDVHHISSLLSLALAVHHLGHRRRFFFRAVHPRVVTPPRRQLPPGRSAE